MNGAFSRSGRLDNARRSGRDHTEEIEVVGRPDAAAAADCK